MELSPYDTDRAAWHLGMNMGSQIPAGDYARFMEACRRIPSSFWYERITNQLDRCDRAWSASEVLSEVATEGTIAPSRLQTISGDTNRFLAVSDPLSADSQYREIYLREVDRLAESLYVSNYRREDVRRYAYERAGSEFIQCLAGPADVAIGTRVAAYSGDLAWR
jgi:hypothetical protein